MTAAARCEFTDLLKDSCAHCHPERLTGTVQFATTRVAEVKADLRPLGPWFFARYDGRCSDCGEEFVPGQKIRSDNEGGYLCEDCGDQS